MQQHAAELIRGYRRAAGLSQRQLADSAGVSIGVIRDLEQRRTARLHAESVRRLAEALDLDELQATEFARAARGRTPQVRVDPGASLLANRYQTVTTPLVAEGEVRSEVQPAGAVAVVGECQYE